MPVLIRNARTSMPFLVLFGPLGGIQQQERFLLVGESSR